MTLLIKKELTPGREILFVFMKGNVMNSISRREFLFSLSSFLALAYQGKAAFGSTELNEMARKNQFPISVTVLQAAYIIEMEASLHYDGYCKRAAAEGYSNIAYLFRAFSTSEKIHAQNYKRILTSLDASADELMPDVLISNTKANLIAAAEKELIKIRQTYPQFLSRLKGEAYDEAVLTCMYSWKSHQQHEKKISQIKKYTPFLFGTVAQKIEDMHMDFHVCEICGSTIDQPPEQPCDICNYSESHYKKIARPWAE